MARVTLPFHNFHRLEHSVWWTSLLLRNAHSSSVSPVAAACLLICYYRIFKPLNIWIQILCLLDRFCQRSRPSLWRVPASVSKNRNVGLGMIYWWRFPRRGVICLEPNLEILEYLPSTNACLHSNFSVYTMITHFDNFAFCYRVHSALSSQIH